MPEAFHKTS